MLTIETREMRRPLARESLSDAPLGLRLLADVAKGAAIATGLEQVAGRAFEVEVDSVRYGAWDRSHEFRQPAEIRVWVSSKDGKGCECLQAATDADLEQAIARSLGRVAQERYRVRIVDKQYGRSEAMRLTVQVGRV